jgi:hypothetical protein
MELKNHTHLQTAPGATSDPSSQSPQKTGKVIKHLIKVLSRKGTISQAGKFSRDLGQAEFLEE